MSGGAPISTRKTDEATAARGSTGPARALLPVPVDDSAARMVLVSHFLAWLENHPAHQVAELVGAGLTPQLIDRLRGLSLSDALRLAAAPCGLTIAVDCAEVLHQLHRVDHQRAEREQFEAFIRCGASPGLTARLFGVSELEVRRRRKAIAPQLMAGGRPRLPCLEEREDVKVKWQELRRTVSRERDRYWQLHQAFPGHLLVALEEVVGSA